MSPKELQRIAYQLRIQVIEMLIASQSGHPGGALGMAEIFSVLYFSSLVRALPTEQDQEDRDRIILSNGHICAILYAAMAKAGYFPESLLQSFRQLGSPLQGHPSIAFLPAVETSSGPLGQGISQAVGMALALKSSQPKARVYCIISDGECEEGQTWEAIMAAAKNQLHNLTIIVDRNHIQIDGSTEHIQPGLDTLPEKFQAFGMNLAKINGHDIDQITQAIESSKAATQPTVILAETTPGKGVSFMEHDYHWHGKAPSITEGKAAILELETTLHHL